MTAEAEFWLHCCPRVVGNFHGFVATCKSDVFDDGRVARCVDGHELTREERARLKESR